MSRSIRKTGSSLQNRFLYARKIKIDSLVRLFIRSIVPVMLVLLAQHVFAQVTISQVMPDTAKMTYIQISQELGLFIYPTKN
jgi:hypothetical protein